MCRPSRRPAPSGPASIGVSSLKAVSPLRGPGAGRPSVVERTVRSVRTASKATARIALLRDPAPPIRPSSPTSSVLLGVDVRVVVDLRQGGQERLLELL